MCDLTGSESALAGVIAPMFDTHCHLQDHAFDADRSDVLAEAERAGVTHIVAPATDLESFDSTLRLINSETNLRSLPAPTLGMISVYGALGIHPHSATEWSLAVRDRIREACHANPKIVAIGEIGLDYHYDYSPRDVQRRAFAEQIALAQELRKPIVVHSRGSAHAPADEDVFAIVKEHYQDLPSVGAGADHPRGQFHCFSSTVQRMQQAIELGFCVSFTGNITFTKSTLSDVVRETPLDRLLIETDSPYLTPHPNRGKRNTPAMLGLVARKVAEIKGVEFSVIVKQTFENALRFFNISISRSIPVLLLVLLSATASYAQRQEPARGTPPDSVLTAERRRTEEIRKKQQAELAKEAELHRQDSIKAAAKDQEVMMAKMQEQARQDSLKAAERLTEEEQRVAFLLTPMPWRAVGIGVSGGIGDMPMSLGKPSLTPLAVFCYTVDIGTAITRRLDFDISYSHLNVGDAFLQDSVWNSGPNTGTHPKPAHWSNAAPPRYLVSSENIGISALSFDLRYVITRPSSQIKFYFGIGYTHLAMTNEQHSIKMKDDTATIDPTATETAFSQTWSRGAIKLLFGIRHDFELGHGVTLEPFAQIAGIGALAGEAENGSFIFQPARDQIIMTQVNLGFMLYYGWFGVPRDQ